MSTSRLGKSSKNPFGASMGAIGSHIEETGTLICDECGFVLRRDVGGRIRLDLHLVSTDLVDSRVRVTGVLVAEGLVDVSGIADA